MEPTQKQQLELITSMIDSARKEFNDDSFHYLLWGWSVCLASLAQFVLLQLNSPYNGMVWLLLPLVAIAQVIMSVAARKKERVRSHTDRIIGYVWIAVGISIGVTLASSPVLQENTYPVLIMLYGIGTFISGGIMWHKPMMAGAACCWAIAMVAFRAPTEYQPLLLSLSLILSYIIPGHMLKNRFRNNV